MGKRDGRSRLSEEREARSSHSTQSPSLKVTVVTDQHLHSPYCVPGTLLTYVSSRNNHASCRDYCHPRFIGETEARKDWQLLTKPAYGSTRTDLCLPSSRVTLNCCPEDGSDRWPTHQEMST